MTRPRSGLPGRDRRPLTRAAVAGLAAHVFFELAAGVGMPLASVLGPAAAAGLWAAAAGIAWRMAGTAPPSQDGPYALFNGAALAAVLGHLTGWPRTPTWLGLPWLTECEGLGPDLMPAYNAILYVSATTALAASFRENRSAPAYLRVLPLGFVPLLIRLQHAEHRRLTRVAHLHPRWWNRRLQPPAGASLPERARRG